MLTTILQEIKSLLQKGITEKGHAFRYCTVATVGLDDTPRQRTMVFRELGEQLELFIYTDQRSPKVKQLTSNRHINLLFYDPKSRIQITIHGIAEILAAEQTIKRWESVQKGTINDYCTTQSPGEPISDPSAISYDYAASNFLVIKVYPKTIEYLRLGQLHHTKAQYIFDNNEWKGTFTVP